jgi:hypothetical protein
MYQLQFSLQAASPETFGNTLVSQSIPLADNTAGRRILDISKDVCDHWFIELKPHKCIASRWGDWCSYDTHVITRAVCKFRGLTLLFRVGTLWRCGDGLFFEVPPLARDALLTTLHPLLENVLQTVDHFQISCLGTPLPWSEKPRNRMGRDLDCMADVLMGSTDPLFPSWTQNSIQISPMRFLGLSNREKGGLR